MPSYSLIVVRLFNVMIVVQRYAKWSHDMRKYELIMLKELGYTVYVDHPHRFILFYVKTIFGSQALTHQSKQLAQKAWNYLNDA